MRESGRKNLNQRGEHFDRVELAPERHGSDQPIQQSFIGCSTAFESILEMIDAVASRKCSVIITGETGAGKEMVARELHLASSRANRTFVPVDCTTLTGQLFESQLFGHVKGAFTGAVNGTLGFFRAANGGTIFLDEISEIPLRLQAKLLRVLQTESITPLGSTRSHRIDVRVLCATNRDLQKMVDEGKFRADLYYRLKVVTLDVPPLRKRKADILPLAEYFLVNQAQFYNEQEKVLSSDCKDLLLRYEWPGNVRELANAMERAYVLTRGREIKSDALPAELIIADASPAGENKLPTLDELKRKVIIQTLKHTGGKKMAAAKILGVERRRLNRMINRLGIPVREIKKKAER